MRNVLFLLLSLSTSYAGNLRAPASNCGPDLTDARKSELVRYVVKKYKLPDSVTLQLARDQLVAGTCYRELTFEGTSSIKTWH